MPDDRIDSDQRSIAERKRRYAVEIARLDHRVREGDLEIDDNAAISWGDDNGAYVQAWLWVEFCDRSQDDRDQDNDHRTDSKHKLK